VTDRNVCTDDKSTKRPDACISPNTLPCDDQNACTTNDVCTRVIAKERRWTTEVV